MAARPVFTISRRKQRQYLLKRWLPGALLALTIIGVISIGFIGPQIYFQDIKGRTLQHSSGVVSSVTYGFADQSGRISPDQAIIAMDNTWVTYVYSSMAKSLWKGQHVQVTYRVGKSGRVYIEDVESVSEAKP